MSYRTFGKFSVVTRCIAATAILVSASFSFAGHDSRGYNKGNSHNGSKSHVKNIIIIVPDGCNQVIQTVARWYKGSELTVDKMTDGTVKTWSANSVITGSAAAGSAFATGFKTFEPHISVGPGELNKLSTYKYPLDSAYLRFRPLATILEGAKAVGKATGLIGTATISHATTASFAAHVPNRSDEATIIEQQVYQNIDVVFGGGGKKLLWERPDGENLKDSLIARGYQFVENRDQMAAVTGGKVWGKFADKYMAPEIDRPLLAPNEPTLAEMTQKAIDILSQNRDGFFLMVEASQVDWGGHYNDPIYCIGDFLQFDEAVKIAVDFAKADGHTAVLAFPDHNTGGMSIGSAYSVGNAEFMTLERLVTPFKGMKVSSAVLKTKLGTPTSTEQIKSVVKEWWGLSIADSIADSILKKPALYQSFLLNYNTIIGWTTWYHDGADVPLWTYNCDFKGTIENTDIANRVFDLLGIESCELNSSLFVDVAEVFNDRILDLADKTNPVLIVNQGGITFRMPINKDLLSYTLPGSATPVTRYLSGLVVNSPDRGTVFIPQDAVDTINRVVAGL